MSKNSETASKLSDLFKPYGVARVTEVPIEKKEYGGGLYRIEFDEETADENPEQPKHFVLCAASADDIPDNFTFIGTRSIEEQPDGRGVIDLGSTDDLNTLTDCLDYIERRGDDEAERDKAIAKARELLESFSSNINEAELFLQESETWIEAIRDDLGNVNPNLPF